jgi:hypothetical protein
LSGDDLAAQRAEVDDAALEHCRNVKKTLCRHKRRLAPAVAVLENVSYQKIGAAVSVLKDRMALSQPLRSY